MTIALLALFAAAFAIGTSEFVIAGILPAVSSDLGISIPTAGFLVSFYALGVAVGGPVLATFTGRFPRKLLLLIYVAIFLVGYVLCALAPSYPVLLVLRVLIALIHGAYFGTAMVTATSIVAENKRGTAVALILSGLTVANIIGVPLGTAIGNAFGWRMTFWAVAALGAVSFALIALLVPADRAHDAHQGNILAGIKALAREPVLTSLAVIILQTIGQFALFTYIAPLLTGVSGIGLDAVPWLLLLFGIGSTLGVLLGGRLADWKLMPSLVGILALQIVIYLMMALFAGHPVVMGALVLVWGATAFAFGSPVQTRILNNTRDAPMLAANLIPSAFNIAIAGGAWLGGTLIDAGASYAILPWVGVAGAVLATATALASALRERRPAA
ncbi:MAG: MFS transporter [Devosia nanyangense]|uniref:MFS transporter n=1 Tax=Devosia nanyangense TaxID=1228055 RepID=A0A933NUZ7_9HYPH|nr:MFS transporter [Devosia nanyangense]